MIRDTRYIIKRVIIGVAIALCLFYLKGCNVYASTATDVYWLRNSFNGTTASIGQSIWLNPNQTYNWTYQNLGCVWSNDDAPTACRGNTNCKLYVDIYFTSNANFEPWAGTSNGYSWSQYKLGQRIMEQNYMMPYYVRRFIFTPNYSQYNQTDDTIAFFRDGTFSLNGGSVDYSSGFRVQSYKCGLIDDMPDLPLDVLNQTTAINNVQNAITIMQNSLQTTITNSQSQTNEWLQKVENAVKEMKQQMQDDSIDTNDQDSKMNTIKNSGYNNASISDIVLLPVTLLNSAVTGLSSNNCSPINLGTLYDTALTLPCITTNDMETWLSSSVYTIIDILMSFCVILGIRKLVLKIYNTIIYLRDGGGTVD